MWERKPTHWLFWCWVLPRGLRFLVGLHLNAQVGSVCVVMSPDSRFLGAVGHARSALQAGLSSVHNVDVVSHPLFPPNLTLFLQDNQLWPQHTQTPWPSQPLLTSLFTVLYHVLLSTDLSSPTSSKRNIRYITTITYCMLLIFSYYILFYNIFNTTGKPHVL